MNQEDIDYFYEKYGQPIDKVEVTEDLIKNIGVNYLKVF